MKSLSDEFDFLKDVLPRLKNLKNMVGVCCVSVRNENMKIVLTRLFKHLEIEYTIKNPMDAYKQLRKLILDSQDLSDSQKITLSKLL